MRGKQISSILKSYFKAQIVYKKSKSEQRLKSSKTPNKFNNDMSKIEENNSISSITKKRNNFINERE